MENSQNWDDDYQLFLDESGVFFSLFDLLDAEKLSNKIFEILTATPSGLVDAQALLSRGWALFDSMLMMPVWDHCVFANLLPETEDKEMNELLGLHLAVAARLRDRLASSQRIPVLPEKSQHPDWGVLVRAELMNAVYPLKLRQLVDLKCERIVHALCEIRRLRG